MKLDIAENYCRSAVLLYSCVVLLVLLPAFAALHFSRGHVAMGALIAAGVPFMLLSLYAARRKPLMPAWGPYPLVLFLVAMHGALVLLWNAEQGAMLMWFCSMPPLAMVLLRTRAGLIVSAVMFAILVAGLLTTEHSLNSPYAARLCGAYLFVTILMYVCEMQRERSVQALYAARERIDTLEGLLNICGWCHRWMCDDSGNWVSTERYFEDRAPVRFSHGLCPHCEKTLTKAEQELGA